MKLKLLFIVISLALSACQSFYDKENSEIYMSNQQNPTPTYKYYALGGEHNKNPDEIMEKIEIDNIRFSQFLSKYSYEFNVFIAVDDSVSVLPEFSVNAHNISYRQVLESMLEQLNLTYTMKKDNHMVIDKIK